jgi:hypothetical protein
MVMTGQIESAKSPDSQQGAYDVNKFQEAIKRD